MGDCKGCRDTRKHASEAFRAAKSGDFRAAASNVRSAGASAAAVFARMTARRDQQRQTAQRRR